MATTKQAGLRMEGINLSFGGLRALSDVTIAANPGEVVGVIGPNGAGKTTLFNVLCGFVKPDAGRVLWRGESLSTAPSRLAGAGISRTMQAPGLCESLTVFENVQLGADRHRSVGFFGTMLGLGKDARSERTIRERSWHLLERFDLVSVADKSPADLPYPERKRVALARALASDPDLLVLDEPAGGLGGSEMTELIDVIGDFSVGGDKIVVLVEHHMDFVLRVCTRLFVLDAGRLIAQGDPQDVVSQQVVQDAYLGVVPAGSEGEA